LQQSFAKPSHNGVCTKSLDICANKRMNSSYTCLCWVCEEGGPCKVSPLPQTVTTHVAKLVSNGSDHMKLKPTIVIYNSDFNCNILNLSSNFIILIVQDSMGGNLYLTSF